MNLKVHMIKRQFRFFVLPFLLALGLPAHLWAQHAALLTPEIAQRIDAVFGAWDNTRSPGCAIGVARNGDVVYARGYGMSNLEYDVAIAPDSIFHVASISKQFTAFAIGLLASDGKLSLNDDIRQYLPEVPDYRQKITIRHLLTHTSGLRDQWNLLRLAGWRPDDLITEDDVLRIVGRQESLNFLPGEEFLYNNTGFTLLAVIVKRVSGQSLRDFAENRIFAPLGMQDTHFHDDHTMIVRRRTSAYEPRPGGGWRISIPSFDTYGATSLFTTVGDLLKWEQNFVDRRVGVGALLDEMRVSGRLNDGSTTGYGLGLAIETFRGARAVGHAGSDAGYRADIIRFPDKDLAIVALCNLSTITPGVLTRRVAEIVLGPGALAPLSPTVSVSQGELAPFVGVYWNPISDDVRKIVMRDGKLLTNASPDALVPLGRNRFRLGEQTTELTFASSTTGVSLQLHAPLLAPAVFTRVTAPSYSGADLKAYGGEYRSDELEVNYSVAVTPEGGLAVLRRKFDPLPLDALKLDVFWGSSLGTVTFSRAPSGEVTGFAISTGRVRHLPFRRVGGIPSTRK